MSTKYITSIGLFYKEVGILLEGVWLWRISGGIHMDLIWNILGLYSNKRIVIFGFEENSEDCKYFLVN